MSDNFLEMKGISKIFPGMKALDNVDLQVDRGDIHVLAGENGAGKSTLIHILNGGIPYGEYGGQFSLDGKPCQFHSVRESERAGIVVIHQVPALIPDLSVAENVFLGNERRGFLGINWGETYRTAAALLNMVGFTGSLSVTVENLSPAERQLVELAKAIGKNVKLLILDEPTAALNETETNHLLNLLVNLKYDGITTVLVSHKIREVARVADKITVLRDGAKIETFERSETGPAFDEDMILKTLVGRSLEERFPSRRTGPGNVLVEIRDWTVYNPWLENRKDCDGVNLTVRRGEIVGLAGLMGSGCSEFIRSVFGKSYGRNVSGSIFLDGRQVHLNSTRDAIRHHIAYISEATKERALLPDESVASNITLANLDRVSSLFVIRRMKERVAAEKYRRELGIKSLDVAQPVKMLSGGSRQKVLLGKWLFTNPDFLILDEPTGGVDVGSKFEFYSIISNLVDEGKGVLMISSEMSELVGMCDRIYVMSEGRIVGELAKSEASQEAIMDCILRAGRRNRGE